MCQDDPQAAAHPAVLQRRPVPRWSGAIRKRRQPYLALLGTLFFDASATKPRYYPTTTPLVARCRRRAIAHKLPISAVWGANRGAARPSQ